LTSQRVQARIAEARARALSLPQAVLLAKPHVRCCIASPPIFEGHLVKLLCAIEHVQQVAAHQAEPPNKHGAAEAPAAGVEQSPEPAPGTADEAGMLVSGGRAFVFLDKATESAAKLRLQVGEALLVMEPWDVVPVPRAAYPVVLAFVVVLCS
jgi:hypothetical protein